MFISFFVGCVDCESATLMGTEVMASLDIAKGYIDGFAQLLNEDDNNPHCYIGMAIPFGVDVQPTPDGEPMSPDEMTTTIAATAKLKAEIEASTNPEMFEMAPEDVKRHIFAHALKKADYFIQNAAWPVA